MVSEIGLCENGTYAPVFGHLYGIRRDKRLSIFGHFMGFFDAKFCPFSDFSQNFNLLCALKQKIKKSLIPSEIFKILPISTHWLMGLMGQ
jgi:hypothetical protein